MTTEVIPISNRISGIVEAIRRGDIVGARAALTRLQFDMSVTDCVPGPATLAVVSNLEQQLGGPALPAGVVHVHGEYRVGDGCDRPASGVSVVTCARNRTENLLVSVSTWLAFPEIAEVIIVDWTSEEPVQQSLSDAGIRDSRVRVVRVDGEPRWVLSYAFNLGFRLASHELILKLDADITLKPDFFKKNVLRGGAFIAGNWEVAEKGQEHINGFFFVHLVDLLRIKGFNEYITTYGWDDDDIYSRLVASGLNRVCVDPSSLWHIPHDDAARLGIVVGGKGNGEAELASSTLAKIRANRYLASVMPYWNSDRFFAPFMVPDPVERPLRVLRKTSDMPHAISPDVEADARYYSSAEILMWRFGPIVYQLDRVQLACLLRAKCIDEISIFDIDLLIRCPEVGSELARRTLYLEMLDVTREELFDLAAEALVRTHIDSNTRVVIGGGSDGQSRRFAERFREGAFAIERWVQREGLVDISQRDPLLTMSREGAGSYIGVTNSYLEKLVSTNSSLNSDQSWVPSIIVRKDKLYVDAQHGLGNRLRAIASAAAIATESGRELVVVWEPDHHCEAKFRELFDYSGALEEKSFVDDVSALNLSFFNYMEIEAGASKDRPIELIAGRDCFLRAAYVFNHPASTWDTENSFLRSLTPSSLVRSLVDSVPVDYNTVGVHVRMEAGAGLDNHSYDSRENWSDEGHRLIHHWREKSHFSRFMQRLDKLLWEDDSQSIFLAADLPETYEAFTACYGYRLRFLPRSRYDRSAEQICFALADAILLSRCNRLLGSTWSSFSELAMRLSTSFSAIEMSGTDF